MDLTEQIHFDRKWLEMDLTTLVKILGAWSQVPGPLYRLLAQTFRRAILEGDLPAGTRLPAERMLAEALAVSRNTVVAAYDVLQQEDLITRQHGSGTWVQALSLEKTESHRSTSNGSLARSPLFEMLLGEPHEVIDLSTGVPAALDGLALEAYTLSEHTLASLLTTAGYAPLGLPELRHAIARYFEQAGLPIRAEHILVTSGAQQALSLAATFYVQRGDTVLVENPTFFGALDTFRALGARLIPLPVDHEGVRVDVLERAVRTCLPRLLYLTSTYHNPTGTLLLSALVKLRADLEVFSFNGWVSSVADITYIAQIQGHRFVLEPRVELGTAPEEVEQIRHHYASHANYAAYKIADTDGNIDGRQGVRLGRPGVSVLDVFHKEYETWIRKAHPEQAQLVVASSKRGRKKTTKENTTGYSTFKPSVQTRAWGDDLRESMRRRLHRDIQDDELLRRIFATYEQQGHQGNPLLGRLDGAPTLSWEQLNVPVETQTILREGMVQTGDSDLLSYLLAAGEREARRLRSLARRHDSECYAAMPTSKLAGMKVPEAGTERYRRAVYTLMQWNEAHRPLEQWYITTLSIQKLVGGRKEAINAYLDAHRDEIEVHHRNLEIKPSYNRKAEPIGQMITIAEEPTAFPWGVTVEG